MEWKRRGHKYLSPTPSTLWLSKSHFSHKPLPSFDKDKRFWSSIMYYYTPRERSSGGYIEITLSVRLSVQIRVRPITFLWFDIGLPYLAHGCITMRRCVAYIHDPDTTLNFDLKIKLIGFLTCFRVRPITFFLVWHWATIFGTWVYHHKTICRVHSWSRYDLELWPQGQIFRVFDKFSCPAHNFFLVWHWPTVYGTWVYNQ